MNSMLSERELEKQDEAFSDLFSIEAVLNYGTLNTCMNLIESKPVIEKFLCPFRLRMTIAGIYNLKHEKTSSRSNLNCIMRLNSTP